MAGLSAGIPDFNPNNIQRPGIFQPPQAQRGTARYDPNTGYAGGAFNDPNTWASDEDYNQYRSSQAPMALTGLQQAAGNTASSVDKQGLTHDYAPFPNLMTNQYQTEASAGPEGGATRTSGQGTLSPMAYEQQQQTQLEAQLAQSGFNNRLKSLSALSTSGGSAPHVEGPMDQREQDARAAAFAREKDTIGNTTRSALNALSGQMSERGFLGSGYENQGVGRIISGGQGQLGDVAREQTIQDLNRAREAGNLRYQGDITQRGQDLQRQQSILALLNAGIRY